MRLPGGESALELCARFLPGRRQITEARPASVVLVSHGGAIRLVAGALAGRPTLDGYVPNTGLVVLPATGDGWELESVDSAPPAPGDVTAGGEPEADSPGP